MALLDDLDAIKPEYRTFEAWLATGPAEKDRVLELVRDRSVPINPLLKALRRNGIPLSEGTVKAYRGVSL